MGRFFVSANLNAQEYSGSFASSGCMHFTRRDFLFYSAASVVSAYIPASRAQGLKQCPIGRCFETWSPPTFPLGVSAGDAMPQRVMLWTYYEGPLKLKVAVWEEGADEDTLPILFADVQVPPSGFVHVDVTQLRPYRAYRYAFLEVDSDDEPQGRSRVGFFKTPPLPDMMVPLKIGAVSCLKNRYEPLLLEHAGARTDLDLFLMLGDTSYNDGCLAPEAFRERWASNLQKKGFLDLRAATSVVATLDDHELFDDFDPETVSPDHLETAFKAFFEHTPIRPHPTAKHRVWRSFRWGQCCEIFVLDCRTERKPSTRLTREAEYISKAQMRWLKDGLFRSDARFKIIMNSVPISAFPIMFEKDRWEGYPHQREEILDWIDSREIPGVLWLSGDFHFASVSRVSSRGPGQTQTEVLAGPGAQMPNYVALGLNVDKRYDWVSVRNNYLTLSLDPKRYEIKLNYLGGDEDPSQTSLSKIEEIYQQILRFHGNFYPVSARHEL